jgi:hypothetical protein
MKERVKLYLKKKKKTKRMSLYWPFLFIQDERKIYNELFGSHLRVFIRMSESFIN